jgi:hypothetical protein
MLYCVSESVFLNRFLSKCRKTLTQQYSITFQKTILNKTAVGTSNLMYVVHRTTRWQQSIQEVNRQTEQHSQVPWQHKLGYNTVGLCMTLEVG